MAKMNLSNYVVATLAADRSAQINMIAAITLQVYETVKAEGDVSGLTAALFKSGPHRAEKTWGNYAAACTALASAPLVTVKLDSMLAAEQDAALCVPLFVSYLEKELKARKHTTSVDDVSRFARGRLSISAQAKADAEAERARLVQVAADEKKATELKAQAEAEGAAKVASTVAEKDANIETAANTPADDTAPTVLPPVESGPQILPEPIPSRFVELFKAIRTPSGDVQVTGDESITRAELVSIALTIEGMLADMTIEPAVVPLPVIDHEMA